MCSRIHLSSFVGGLHYVGTHGGGAVRIPVRVLLARLRPVIAAGICLTIGLAAMPVKAQILYGTVVGVVRDGTGALIPGAVVTIVNKDTNLTREATTNSEGGYSLINLLPGPYDVKVSLTGFREVARPNVDVTIGQIARVDFTLEIGTVAESVMVVGESP